MTAAWSLDAAAVALALGAAVLTPLGWRFQRAATVAVVCVAGVFALVDVPTVIAVGAGGLAAVYLLAAHSVAVPGVNALTAPAVGGVLGGCAVALGASIIPVAWPWWPLVGPVAAVVVYATVISPMVATARALH